MEFIHDLKSKFDIYDAEVKGDLVMFSLDREVLVPVLLYLKEHLGFKTLIMISCVDWIEDGKFQLSYILWNPKENINIVVRVFIPRESPEFVSVSHIWAQAETFERELREMYGVVFKGNERQYEDFLLEGWDGPPPMRRDFDSRMYSLNMYGEKFKKSGVKIRKEISEQYDEWRRR